MPTSSFDTFFACTIIVAVALIAMAFLGSTMQTRIESTQDIDKDSYLKAIADHILTTAGSPADWGTSSALPSDLGLAVSGSEGSYELDADKICRLNSANNYALSNFDLSSAMKLNVALGIEVSQLLTVNIVQSSNSSVGGNTRFVFDVSTTIDSKPASASLHCYVSAESYLTEINASIPDSGVGEVTVQVPTDQTSNALLITFARATIDDRMTSCAIYNLAHANQESAPSAATFGLSPLAYTLNLNKTVTATVQNDYAFSYSQQQALPAFQNSHAAIPKIIDHSPIVLVVGGSNGSTYFQEWTAYPQLPLKIGSHFTGSAQNVCSYLVTINGVLYRLDLSLGDLPK